MAETLEVHRQRVKYRMKPALDNFSCGEYSPQNFSGVK